jgi:hypothetical protein
MRVLYVADDISDPVDIAEELSKQDNTALSVDDFELLKVMRALLDNTWIEP